MRNANEAVLAEMDCHHPMAAARCTHAIPLSMARKGECVRVKCVCGKDETRRLLCNLGFVENTEVKIITEMDGNVIVTIKGTRLAVSKVMARRVMTV
jgi:ferrous iron transport protein A